MFFLIPLAGLVASAATTTVTASTVASTVVAGAAFVGAAKGVSTAVNKSNSKDSK